LLFCVLKGRVEVIVFDSKAREMVRLKRSMKKVIGTILCLTIGLGVQTGNVLADDLSVNLISVNGMRIGDISLEYPKDSGYAICELNVRDKPSTDGKIITTLHSGDEVEITGYDSDWADIGTGYVYAGYLTKKWYDKSLTISCDDMEAAKSAGYVYEVCHSIPDGYVDVLKHYKIEISNSSAVLLNNEYGAIAGYASTMSNGVGNVLCIKCDLFSIDGALLHEVGHTWDHWHWVETGKFLSDDENFVTAYNDEVQDFHNSSWSYGKSVNTSAEYFAELFLDYYRDDGSYREEMQETLPESYSALESLLYKDV
jgi:hypothetical protein